MSSTGLLTPANGAMHPKNQNGCTSPAMNIVPSNHTAVQHRAALVFVAALPLPTDTRSAGHMPTLHRQAAAVSDAHSGNI